ncbi:MAG: ATP-binding protein [Acidobacteriota bacterium]
MRRRGREALGPRPQAGRLRKGGSQGSPPWVWSLGLTAWIVWSSGAAAVPTEDDPRRGLPLLVDHSLAIGEQEVWDVAQTEDGVMYFATGGGVVEYDGVSSRALPLANDSIARSLAAHPSDRVFVGGIGEVGVVEKDDAGRISYRPLVDQQGQHLEGLRDVWRMWSKGDGFVAWTLDRVLAFDGRAFSSWPLDKRTMPGWVRGQLVMTDNDGGLQAVVAGELLGVGKILGLGGERVRIWLEEEDGGGVLGTGEGHLWRIDAESMDAFADAVTAGVPMDLQATRLETEADPILGSHRLYQGTVLQDGRLALATMTGGAAVIDSEGRLLYRLHRDAGLPDDAVWSAKTDRDGGLWLGMSQGLVRAATELPFTGYDELQGLDGRVQAVARSGPKLWAATNLGLFERTDDRFQAVPGIPGPCWSLHRDGDGDTLLVGASDGVHVLDGRGLRPVLEIRHGFTLHPSRSWPGILWVGSEEGLAVLRKGPGGWVQVGDILDLGAQARSIAEADDGSLWIGTFVSGAIRVDPSSPERLGNASVRPLGPREGLEALNSVKLFSHAGDVYAATGTGLLIWSDSSDRFESSQLFGDDTGGIARVAQGAHGDFWLSRDDAPPLWIRTGGIERGAATHLFRHLPSMDVYGFLPEPGGGSWIATGKGLFYHRGIPDDRKTTATSLRRLSLREVRVDGEPRSLVTMPLELPATDSRIRFSWASPGPEIPIEGPYRFRLRGLEREWSPWSNRTEAEYLHLPGGRYTFEVEGRNLLGEVFATVNYGLRAPRPWFATWPAWIAWGLLLVGVVWAGISIRSLKLRRERDRLEREVQARTRDLRIARDQARAATEVKSQFLAKMSHEIRTPMNGVIGMTELLLDSQLAKDQRRHAEVLRSCGNALLSLVNDILDFSKIEAGELQLQTRDLDLRDLADSVVAMLAPIAKDKGLELSARMDDAMPRFWGGDPNRLRQVLLNLVGNAIKFTDEGGVRVEVGPAAEGEDADADPAVPGATVRFEVVDTGIGIPKDQLDRLFKPFSQVDGSSTRRHSGSGLGLMISKQLVERMGGRIGVDTAAGEGSTFWFTAPLDAVEDPPEPSIRSRDTPVPRPGPLRLLLVEDNPVNQLVAASFLEEAGHEVTVAGGGEEALGIFAERPFDMVLTDIDMPDMDGLEVAARIRGWGDGRGDIPIVAMTAHAIRGDREAFLAAGMDGYVAKPFRPQELYAAIDALAPRTMPAPRD